MFSNYYSRFHLTFAKISRTSFQSLQVHFEVPKFEVSKFISSQTAGLEITFSMFPIMLIGNHDFLLIK